MVTVTGQLLIGHRDASGALHKDFEMRVPTIEDMEWSIENAPEGACTARLSRYVWSRALTRLGALPSEAITPELLAGLHYSDYTPLSDAEEALRGKLVPASSDCETTGPSK
ncbi:hypothetical protein DVDV_0647 [Desulfovibrio sp. DV]|uniref:hypothetical protein n=1 Tax=Desulfovibrio sp. DV TaxID=1844708 RepID=UPI00094BC314|nr:hypothetical protein [Desulfovibrio sp. DV]OLN30447.1 hypothetical protein DVDV_0647 [Desulfovibrio sp. DV]